MAKKHETTLESILRTGQIHIFFVVIWPISCAEKENIKNGTPKEINRITLGTPYNFTSIHSTLLNQGNLIYKEG